MSERLTLGDRVRQFFGFEPKASTSGFRVMSLTRDSEGITVCLVWIRSLYWTSFSVPMVEAQRAIMPLRISGVSLATLTETSLLMVK